MFKWFKISLLALLLAYPGLTFGLSGEDGLHSLVVGTKVAPPFAVKNDQGVWSGMSIELWREIAADAGLSYEFEERDLAGLLEGLQDGSLDAAVAALTITARREEMMDFSHPFHTSGLGIAVLAGDTGGWLQVVERFFSPEFLKGVGSLGLVLLLFGFLVWLFERRKNPDQFGGGVLKGIGSGFWWSAVTMTTVGYGDKAPASLGGRLVAMIWMFAAIIIISSFTAAITSSLTVSRLESRIRGPEDLARVRVASVPSSTSAAYLEREHIAYSHYPDPAAAVAALSAGKVDAVVYDLPILRDLAVNGDGSVMVLPKVFERQDYGIGLPAGSPLRESVNRILLEKINSPWWDDILYRYLGTVR